jgi:hypothetical protein
MKRIKIVDNAENEDVEESDEEEIEEEEIEEEIVDVLDGDLEELILQQKAEDEAKIIAEIERLRVLEEARLAEADINVENRIILIRQNRVKTNINQAKNATKMLSNSNKLLGSANVGDAVCFFSSEFDRGIADPPNILCRIIYIDEHVNYQLACGAGILDRYMARNAFQIFDSVINFPIRRDRVLSPREAITELSVGDGQGFIRCNCTAACATNKCSCKKENLKCKSRCHGGNNNCTNKV